MILDLTCLLVSTEKKSADNTLILEINKICGYRIRYQALVFVNE